jgi:RHS repeat-associated protein
MSADSRGCQYYYWDGLNLLARANLTTGASRSFTHGQTPMAGIGNMVEWAEDGAGALRQRQVYGDAPIVSVGDIAMMEASGKTYVPDADQVGTLWQVLDSSASLANAYQYDAFGVGRATSESFSNPFRFAGKHLDKDPALYHFIARQYDPRLGRFISRDPAGYGRAFSVYLYCRSMPGWYVDPMGLDWGPAEHRQAAEEEALAVYARDVTPAILLPPLRFAQEVFGCSPPPGVLQELADLAARDPLDWPLTFVSNDRHGRADAAGFRRRESEYASRLSRLPPGYARRTALTRALLPVDRYFASFPEHVLPFVGMSWLRAARAAWQCLASS